MCTFYIYQSANKLSVLLYNLVHSECDLRDLLSKCYNIIKSYCGTWQSPFFAMKKYQAADSVHNMTY